MKFIIHFILYVISSLGQLMFEMIGVLTGMWTPGYFKNVAISKDQTLNVILAPLFNLIMFKWSAIPKIKFGNPDQTISYVLGRNSLDNNLNAFGRFWVLFLNKIEDNHTNIAVENEEK